MEVRQSHSKVEMSHSDLASSGKKYPIGVHLSQKTVRRPLPIHGIHYSEITFKTSSPTKKLEKERALLMLGEVGEQLANTGLRK